ncbi:MAG: nucleoside recognition domain-containing protein [Methanomicrobiales archaeon]|nr:nucleoside recognition domain-containing protein [Methanomicrobiales archaeon]
MLPVRGIPVELVPAYILDLLLDAVVLVSAGIIIASIAVETGVLKRLGIFMAPLSRLSGLSHSSMLCLMGMFVNPTAGKAMVSEMYRKEEVEREEVIPLIVMSTFPVVLGELLFRVQLPTAVLLMGPVVGGIHTLLNLFSSLLQMVGAMLYTRLVLRRGVDPEGAEDGMEREPLRLGADVIRDGLERALPDLKRIVPTTVVAILVFTILSATGALELLRYLFDPVLSFVGLPGESSTALMAQFLRAYAGYAIVASLIAAGVLTLKQALLTLIIGSMLVITLIYIRYTLPLNLSLFGRFGVRITIVSYVASMGAKLVTICLIVLLL